MKIGDGIAKWKNLKSADKGINLLIELFEANKNIDQLFDAHVSAVSKQSNGWGLEKHLKGYVFSCFAEGTIDNFPHADLWFYRPQQTGNLILWQTIEDDDIFLDHGCFISEQEIVKMLDMLRQKNFPVYDPDRWISF